jgi:GH43 family beta-xylosidase
MIFMKTINKNLILLIIASIYVAFTFQTNANGYTNPISNYSPEDYANPSVVYYSGYYYGVNNENSCTKIVIYKSSRLENLYFSPKVTVWTAPTGTDHSEGIWAPCLQYVQGNWYIYYTATFGGVLEYHRMFALRGNSQDPQGSYTDVGSVYATNTDFYAIDGKVIVKPTDGSLYFVWSGAASLPLQNIYIAPMDNPTHINGPAVMISGTTAGWENPVHEGPSYIHKNGKSIIMYATGELLNPGAAGYKSGTLTNTDGNYLNASSWVKSSGSVFQMWSGTGGTVYAPGACSFVKSPDGTEDWMVYHAKHFNDNNYNREIRTQKFTWDSNNNPLFDHPVPSGIVLAVPSGQDPLPSEIVSGGTYKIIARHSSKALTVQSSSTLVGAPVEQRTYSGTNNQKWIITDLGNGYYKIIAKHSNLALDVANYSIDNGTGVIQQVYTGYDDELWKICNLGNGYYVLTNKNSQKCLDVVGGATTNGALVDQWSFFGNNNQEWQLTRLTGAAAVEEINTDLKQTESQSVNVFPNPASNLLIIDTENISNNISYRICDLAGKILLNKDNLITSNNFEINTTSLENGVYILKLQLNNKVYSKEIIIKK